MNFRNLLCVLLEQKKVFVKEKQNTFFVKKHSVICINLSEKTYGKNNVGLVIISYGDTFLDFKKIFII